MDKVNRSNAIEEAFLFGIAFAVAAVAMSVAGPARALSLEEGFRSPPDSAKPQVYYFMMNGNITKEGLTCDFEAMANAGLGGMIMLDLGGVQNFAEVTRTSHLHDVAALAQGRRAAALWPHRLRSPLVWRAGCSERRYPAADVT